MKGGFQNVVGSEVLDRLASVAGTMGLGGWVSLFVSLREFEVSWDRKVRGAARSTVGIPQGSPLSPDLILGWVAPMWEEMECCIVEEMPGVALEFPSYVDDLHFGLYDGRYILRGLNELERRDRMEEALDRVSTMLKEVALERGL